MPPKNEFASAIRNLRTQLRLSQQQFSDLIGVTLRTVAHYENDRPPTDLKMVDNFYHLAIEAKRFDLADIFRSEGRSTYSDSVDRAITQIYMECRDARGQIKRKETLDVDALLEQIQYQCIVAFPPLEIFQKDLTNLAPEERQRFFDKVFTNNQNRKVGFLEKTSEAE